ncbi:hypothetical protein DA075_22655 [Methylobacterium currus]|jgi:hypothetical protein|uniref:DUF6894 domain-containing protein n=1 Tax=Methylobacterium currus TaxID=2051553 RepID=A0A2R4WP72_9HYPH|nr:hypothetical protein [Methylobacterium currus]AWB23352.1 hypothetical protein DA075_22655 [Methylobacterium currus]UHC17010.1 hypothetical protein LRS73_03585 [Methylobacterium currus]
MPLYYVNRFDGIAVIDDVGIELPDLDAARDHVRSVLTEMMNAERWTGGAARCRADVRDASGRPVLEASLILTMSPEPRQMRP